MVSEIPSEHHPEQQLQAWISDLWYQLTLLEKVLLPEEFGFDYTPASLDALEAHLLAQDESGLTAELLDAATAYLGEVLLGVAGGAWGWHTRPVDGPPGQPVVWPDRELELSPVAPRLLIAHALRVRTRAAFAAEVARLREEVAERQEAVPGWEPVKEYRPGLDPGEPLPEHPALTAWLAERKEAHPAWAKDAFGGAWRWNPHADTLGWLYTVVRQRFATVEEFDAALDEPFVQGACWYLGEVIRRNQGAVWQYVPFDPEAGPGAPGSRENAWTEVPFVHQPDKRLGGAAEPLTYLRDVLLHPEYSLQDVLLRFRSCSYAYVGSLLQRIGMVSREKVDSVIEEYGDYAHKEERADEVPDMLEVFGVAISASADSVGDLEESYEYLLEWAASFTDGAVGITDVRLDREAEVLEFVRNGVRVTEPTDHQSDRYLDHLAVDQLMDHVNPKTDEDTRRFHYVDFVRREHGTYDSYYVFASPEQAAVLEKELGLDLH